MESILPISVALLLLIVLYAAAVKLKRLIRKEPPGPIFTWPFVGDTPYFVSQGVADYVRGRASVYGPVFQTSLVFKPFVVVADAASVRQLMLGEDDTVVTVWPESARRAMGPGSMSMNQGKRHRTLRRLFEPAFRQGAVVDMVPTTVEITQEQLRKWAQKGRINGYKETLHIPFLVALRTGMGYRKEDLDPELLKHLSSAFTEWLKNVVSIPIDLPGFGFHSTMRARKTIEKELLRLLALLRDRAARGEGGQQVAETILDARDETGKPLTDSEIMDNLVTFLFAAHDTTGNSMLHLLSYIGLDQRVLTKLRAEQAQVVSLHGEEISGAALDAMPYVDAVIKEATRIQPSVGGAFRRAFRTFELGGYTIDKGKDIFLGLGHVMRSDPRWQDAEGDLAPDRFYPERWFTEEGQKAGAFMPFGVGVRMCIGWRLATAEMRVFVALLARHYEWTVLKPPVSYKHTPFPVPTDELQVDFKELQ